jgi:hypothetical protein
MRRISIEQIERNEVHRKNYNDNNKKKKTSDSTLKYREQLLMLQKEDPKYVILKQFTSYTKEESKKLLKYLQNLKPAPHNIVIQNSTSNEANDNLRLHYKVEELDNEFRDKFNHKIDFISNSLDTLVTSCFSGLLAKSKMSILLSKAGCRRQDLHTDYPLAPTKEYRTVYSKSSFFALVALMDGTSIVLGDNKVKMIDRGDVLIGRGDLVHAGNSYGKDNFRLHYYFDNIGDNHIDPRDTFFCYKLSANEMKKCAKEPFKLKQILEITRGKNLVAFNLKDKEKKDKRRISQVECGKRPQASAAPSVSTTAAPSVSTTAAPSVSATASPMRIEF